MAAITDTRKRSREDEDTCDFMAISKRINNLTLTSQCLGDQDTSNTSNFNSNAPINQFMAINNQEIQTQHFAQHALANNYANGMSHHYLIHEQTGNATTSTHNPNYHQSPVVQSTNHSNHGFHNGSHLALGTNEHKQSQQQLHHHHHQQQHHPQHHHHHQTHPATHSEQNNNEMNNGYCPELPADKNPFYYDKNKLLFDLHAERQRRHQSHH